MLSAALLTTLTRRRARLSWYNPDIPPEIETALIRSADVGAAVFVDRALRGLATALANPSGGPPTLYSAVIGPDWLTLSVAASPPPEPQLEQLAGWVASEDGQTWSIGRDDAELLQVPAGIPPPYPGLVPMGTYGQAWMLINLAAAPGLIALTGSPQGYDVAASLAMSLAASPWSEKCTVSLVGFDEDLTVVAPSRIHHCATVEDALDAVEYRVAVARQELTADSGGPAILPAPRSDPDQSSCRHEFVLISSPPPPEDAARIIELVTTQKDPEKGAPIIRVLTVGDTPAALWKLTVHDGYLTGVLPKLTLGTHPLSSAERRAVIEMFRSLNQSSDARAAGGPEDVSARHHHPPRSRRPSQLDPAGRQ